MQTDEKVIQRIDQLIQKGEQAKNRYVPSPPGVIGGGHIEYSIFNEWKSNSENLIIRISGQESAYYKNFLEQVKQSWPEHVESGMGILRALREDVSEGFLTDLKELAFAEIFIDFIDIAEHLLENGYKDPSASLIGAVLEDSLRKIADKNGIDVKNNDDISSLNTKLADKSVYNRLLQKQIQAWKAIRDSADHGKFKDYTKEDVEAMLSGVQRFLGEYL